MCYLNLPLDLSHPFVIFICTHLLFIAAMYDLFQVMLPSVAEHCSLTLFLSLRPWNVTRPVHRTCLCVYHNRMKYALKDCAAAYQEAHKKCGSSQGCPCGYYIGGSCKTQRPFGSYEDIEKLLLHPAGEGATKPSFSCAKGMCARDDKCGPFDHRTVSVTGSEAGRLEFGDGGEIGGVFTGLKAVKRKRDDDQRAVDGLMEKLAAANVTAGCVLVTVTSRTGVPIRCLTKSDSGKEIAGIGAEETATLQFVDLQSLRRDIPIFQCVPVEPCSFCLLPHSHFSL